uniref:Uncharacterized protein n=1 Tax=Caulobacter phage BL57 TaxID=3348355 RepID=A0AB74UMG6_9VIRU
MAAPSIHDILSEARRLISHEAAAVQDPPPDAVSDVVQVRLRKLLRFVVLVEQASDLAGYLKIASWERVSDAKKRLHQRQGPFGPDATALRLFDDLVLKLKDIGANSRRLLTDFSLDPVRTYNPNPGGPLIT